jgi:hypothetical protein
VDDVDLNRGTVFVRLGKGAKDRVVPIGERACRWIERYLFQVRPELVDVDDDGALCLAKHGQNGADIRYIQALLGHADLSTTEVYTQVSIQQLKAVHEKTHPARMPGLGGAQSRAVDPDRYRRRQERCSGRLTAPLSLDATRAGSGSASRGLQSNPRAVGRTAACRGC